MTKTRKADGAKLVPVQLVIVEVDSAQVSMIRAQLIVPVIVRRSERLSDLFELPTLVFRVPLPSPVLPLWGRSVEAVFILVLRTSPEFSVMTFRGVVTQVCPMRRHADVSVTPIEVPTDSRDLDPRLAPRRKPAQTPDSIPAPFPRRKNRSNR